MIIKYTIYKYIIYILVQTVLIVYNFTNSQYAMNNKTCHYCPQQIAISDKRGLVNLIIYRLMGIHRRTALQVHYDTVYTVTLF